MPKPINTGPQWVGQDLAIKPGFHPLVAKAILYRLGFELLGTGACAAAFRLGQSDRVVKLVCDRAGHRAAVELFRACPEVEAFPTIFAYAELTNDCFIYETELLEEGGNVEGTYAGSWEDSSFYQGEVDDIDWDAFANDFGQDAADAIERLADDTSLYVDLHPANWMTRGASDDYAPVIIDPLHRFWTCCEDGKIAVKSGLRSRYDRGRIVPYWRNVASTTYRGATTTALAIVTQA